MDGSGANCVFKSIDNRGSYLVLHFGLVIVCTLACGCWNVLLVWHSRLRHQSVHSPFSKGLFDLIGDSRIHNDLLNQL